MKNYISPFLLLLAIMTFGLASCGGEDEPNAQENEEELTILSPCKYSINLDGIEIEKELSLDLSGISCNVTFGRENEANSYGATLYSNDSEESLSFFRGVISNLQFGENPSPEQFDSLFYIGLYDFTEGGNGGIQMSYRSSDNEVWSTSKGMGNQSGSRFELLEKVSETISRTYVINARVQFKCNLFNEAGDMKVCEGTATVAVQNS